MYSNVGPASSLTTSQSLNTPKQSTMAEHAQRLHSMAGDLNDCNARLFRLLDRMRGATPQAAGETKPQPEPNGVLYVAQFGAERIGLELAKIQSAISELETIA